MGVRRLFKAGGKKRLHFSVLIFFVCLLFTFLIWDRFFNSPDPVDRNVASTLILVMGLLFSTASGLFVWVLESRQEYLEKELKRRGKELKRQADAHRMTAAASTAICWLSQLIVSDQKLENLLESVMDLVKKVLEADEGSLMLLDSNNELYVAKSSGIDKQVAKNTRVKIGEKIAGKAAELRREFLIVGELDKYPEFKGLESNPHIRCSIVCPLLAGDRLLGVLNLNRTVTEGIFTEVTLQHAMIFASQIAQAILNNRGDIPHRVLLPQSG